MDYMTLDSNDALLMVLRVVFEGLFDFGFSRSGRNLPYSFCDGIIVLRKCLDTYYMN